MNPFLRPWSSSFPFEDGSEEGEQGASEEEVKAEEEEARIFKEELTLRQASILKAITVTKGPRETLERLKGTWSTFGVVSALFMTFSIPAIYHPPITPQLIDLELGTAFQVCNSAAGAASTAVVILSTIFLARTGELCSNDHAKDFITFVAPYHQTLVLLFICSLNLLCAAVISITWLNAKRTVALILTCLWGFGIFTVTVIYAHVFLKNHKMLKQHVDMVNKQKAALADKLKLSSSRVRPVCE